MKKQITAFVLYDKANDSVVRHEDNSDIVIFNNINDADAECRGNETILKFSELNDSIKCEILDQIKKH